MKIHATSVFEDKFDRAAVNKLILHTTLSLIVHIADSSARSARGDRIIVHAPATDVDVVNQSVDNKTAARPVKAENIADFVLKIGVPLMKIKHVRSLKTIHPRGENVAKLTVANRVNSFFSTEIVTIIKTDADLNPLLFSDFVRCGKTLQTGNINAERFFRKNLSKKLIIINIE